jgi:hypothetical protein
MTRSFMLRSILTLFSILTALLFTVSASAQNYKLRAGQKQTLNFEDELVEGSAGKPELFYLFQKKNFNYTRLIKLRENFLPEMRKTSEDIQRLRGGR